jgi:hypothetical protein
MAFDREVEPTFKLLLLTYLVQMRRKVHWRFPFSHQRMRASKQKSVSQRMRFQRCDRVKLNNFFKCLLVHRLTKPSVLYCLKRHVQCRQNNVRGSIVHYVLHKVAEVLRRLELLVLLVAQLSCHAVHHDRRKRRTVV